mgnify:CR=1 FL=1
MRLLEVVRGEETSGEVLASSLAVAKRIGKLPVVVGNCFGFVGNRLLAYYRREAELLLEEGATVEQIDRVLVGFGMPVGPFAMQNCPACDGKGCKECLAGGRVTKTGYNVSGYFNNYNANKLGVTKYEQIANFSDEDIANLDETLALEGRLEKDDWVGQAQQLLAEQTAAEVPAEEAKADGKKADKKG